MAPINTDLGVTLTQEDRADLARLVEALRSGEVSVCSPCDGMNTPWTEDEVSRCSKAFAEAFGWQGDGPSAPLGA